MCGKTLGLLMAKQEKYFTEVSLLQATKCVMLLKPAELERISDMLQEQRDTINKSHIYFVCQRPRVRISEISKCAPSGIEFTLEVMNNNKTTQRKLLVMGEELPPHLTSAQSHENGAYLTFIGNGGETPLMPIDFLLTLAQGSLPELAHLEVVYIGQAYGDLGSRSAIDRLKSHSTLQKVLAEQAHTAWWMESVLLLFIYDQPQLISRTDGCCSPAVTEDEDTVHFMSILENPLSEIQLVTIAEASLIRYFKPKYNTHFKGNYPTSELAHLRDAYRLDYNAIITEIDTEDIFLNTFSEHCKPSGHHIAQFDLHDPAERFSFFDIGRDKTTKGI